MSFHKILQYCSYIHFVVSFEGYWANKLNRELLIAVKFFCFAFSLNDLLLLLVQIFTIAASSMLTHGLIHLLQFIWFLAKKIKLFLTLVSQNVTIIFGEDISTFTFRILNYYFFLTQLSIFWLIGYFPYSQSETSWLAEISFSESLGCALICIFGFSELSLHGHLSCMNNWGC